MTTKQILLGAAKLLSKRGSWTQGDIARDSEGKECDYDAAEAVCWCLEGAIRKAGAGDWTGQNHALMAVGLVVGVEGLGAYEWNDKKSRRRTQVVEALREAAKDVR